MRFVFSLVLGLASIGCASTEGYMKTVDKIEINKFMGDWYVLAGRFTFLEKEVHNALEQYTWNESKNRIDIGFTYNKGSLTGPLKSIPQKGWIYNQETKAHWKVSPLWPLKLDYLIVAIDKDYRWTAIGVPNQNYLWIMARDWKNPQPIIDEAVKKLNEVGYKSDNLTLVPHQWPKPVQK